MRALYVLAGDLWIYMSLWFVISIIKKRSDVADIAWGLGFILLSWISYYFGHPGSHILLINILVSLWGTRLALHIYSRNKNIKEDSRYAAWRKSWGPWHPIRSYFQIFLLQGVLLFLVATPILFANLASPEPSSLYLLGLLIWLIGFTFEAIGDYQLAKFKRSRLNKGKIMTQGLWAYTRHPNYFGEVSLWWGIFLMVLPSGWYTIIGPLTITLLILGLSGIPMLERRYLGDKDYQKYQARVSAFFPRPPKKSLVK